MPNFKKFGKTFDFLYLYLYVFHSKRVLGARIGTHFMVPVLGLTTMVLWKVKFSYVNLLI